MALEAPKFDDIFKQPLFQDIANPAESKDIVKEFAEKFESLKSEERPNLDNVFKPSSVYSITTPRLTKDLSEITDLYPLDSSSGKMT